jgi:hypothetical protein
VLKLPYQVVELEIDEAGNEVARKVVPYPYQSRNEALAAVKTIASEYSEARLDESCTFWSAIGSSGERLRIGIEEVPAPPGS